MTDPALPYDALPQRRSVFRTRSRQGLVILLVGAAALALPLWDFVILPVYENTRLPITVAPVLLSGLCTLVLFWLFLRIKPNQKDPVRRRPATTVLGLIVFVIVNLAAFFLFDRAWAFTSTEARWVGIALVIVNINGAVVLLYLFGMRWNRKAGVQMRIHDAIVHDLRKAPAWYEPSPYLHHKDATGWHHSSSTYTHAVYFAFARAYEVALGHLQNHLTQAQIDQWDRTLTPEAPREDDTLAQVLAAPLEPCLKAGNTLVGALAFFKDANEHRTWMVHEIAWRMLNVKLLHVAVGLKALPEASNPTDIFHTDLADLKRLYHRYQGKTIRGQVKEGQALSLPLHTLATHTQPWHTAALQNRLCMLFLRGLYHTREHEENLKQWAALWHQPLDGTPLSATEKDPTFFDAVAAVWAHLDSLRKQGVQFETWTLERFLRQLAMEAHLPSPLTCFLNALTALTTTLAPEEDAVSITGITLPGFEADGLDDDLTNLLLTLPQLDADDVGRIDFPTLWTHAKVLWMLEDLLYFERTLSSVQFKDMLQDPLWRRVHPQIRPAVRRLLQTPYSRQRWRENQTLLAQKAQNPTLTLQQTWEEIPLGI